VTACGILFFGGHAKLFPIAGIKTGKNVHDVGDEK